MKTAIYALYQRKEFDKFKCFYSQFSKNLSAEVKLHVLINDDDCLKLRQVLSQNPYVFVYCEGGNLGVAGGRNYLIDRAIENGAEFLISCDSDIIFPGNYISRLQENYKKLKQLDTDLGFVQPILLNGPDVLQCFPELIVENWVSVTEVLGSSAVRDKDFWETTLSALGEEKAIKTVFHAGVSNIWKAHFDGSIRSNKYDPSSNKDFLRLYRTLQSNLRSDPKELFSIISEGVPVRCMSVAGGVTAFHADVWKRIDKYNFSFNPFGFEDSELGFRSTMSGLNNYLFPDISAIHDIFLVGSNRSPMSQARIGRLRGVDVSGNRLSDEEIEYAFGQSLFGALRPTLSRFFDFSKSDSFDVETLKNQIPSFLLSYYSEFFVGIKGNIKEGRVAEDLIKKIPIFDLLRGFLGQPVTVEGFSLPLCGAFLRADSATAKLVENNPSKTCYAFSLVNCRVEEDVNGSPGGVLSSRYFDLNARLYSLDDQNFDLKIDVQLDNVVHIVKSKISLNEKAAMKDGLARLHEFSVSSKKYDFGDFSVEDIYPRPSLFKSVKWLPVALKEIDIVRKKAAEFDEFLRVLNTAESYLTENIDIDDKEIKFPVSEGAKTAVDAVVDSKIQLEKKLKVLIFTDSRGQHKPAGSSHEIFAERLARDSRIDLDAFLCPMKWTTTLDFLENFPPERLALYDRVILYTGIVEWSPRPASSAREDLYDNIRVANMGNATLNTRDYSKKIVNNKKYIFDKIFGADAMEQHLGKPFDVEYEGKKTINMYSLEMAKSSIIPILEKIPNLIFINSNYFVPGWEGDFKRGRPENIRIIESYSDIFSEKLIKAGVSLVDLRAWSREDVQINTCDNMHLTKRGSDYIFDQIMEKLDVDFKTLNITPSVRSSANFLEMSGEFAVMCTPERITAKKKPPLLERVGRKDFLATLIIGVRVSIENPARNENIKTLLCWIDHFYGDLFDVLIVEQDSEPRISLKDLDASSYVRHEFIFNPQEYNRGWGYNVAISRFCKNSEVVVLMDTDVLTGVNFVREIIDCYGKYDAISPYQNIYYANADEVAEIKRSLKLEFLLDAKKIKNPVTISGGVLIIKRSVFMGVNGFEQYVGYGCEDRALDVTLLNHLPRERIRLAGHTYVHLYHAADQSARVKFKEIYEHLVTNYGCKYEPTLGPYDFIHEKCHHVSQAETSRLIKERAFSFGDVDLYRSSESISINGVLDLKKSEMLSENLIFPPDFVSLSEYAEKELYAKVPEPDVEDWAALYNAFKGKRCFIIGNGPSLNEHDLSLLKGEYTFGVNSFYYKTRETGFRPHFYVVEDSSVMKENIEEIKKFDAPYKFFPTNYKSLHPKQPNTLFFRMNRGFYEKSSPNYVVPRFSTDASKVLYCGQSVTYINLQLAYFMGFTEVYLIGMDFSYVIPESHKRTGDVLLSDTDDPNHFHKDYFGKGKTWKDPKLDRVALNYKQAKLVYEATGRRIFNATKGGSLEIFERIDYDELLTGRKIKNSEFSPESGKFAEANKLFQEGKYNLALSIYVGLARNNPDFFTYKRATLDSYLRAVEAGVICNPNDVAYVRGLIVGF